MVFNDSIAFWRSYFLNEKRALFKALGRTDAWILKDYETSLREHINSLPLWQKQVSQDEYQGKRNLIFGLEEAIVELREK